MAAADQLLALLDSFAEGDDQRFYSVAMQLAAHEAKLGHGKLAEELRAKIDQAKRRRGVGQVVPIARPRGELAGVLAITHPKARLAQLILREPLAKQIQRVLREQRHAGTILHHGLSPRRKLLLVGPPGTGKTLTALVLAGELGLPLLEVRLDGLITRFMGETAAKLRQLFESTNQTRGVYFFDEFDAIGAQRGLLNDVGEVRRILNSFLQMIEQDTSHSLILAATNHPELLDPALFRRFDDVLNYELPSSDQIAALLKGRLGAAVTGRVAWVSLAKASAGLSLADISRACDEVLKHSLMSSGGPVSYSDIRRVIEERQEIGQRWPRRP